MKMNITTANVAPSASEYDYSFVLPTESFEKAEYQRVTDSDIDYVIDRYEEALRLLGE